MEIKMYMSPPTLLVLYIKHYEIFRFDKSASLNYGTFIYRSLDLTDNFTKNETKKQLSNTTNILTL